MATESAQETAPAFVQITGVRDDLYALDGQGRVWVMEVGKWRLVGNEVKPSVQQG